MSDTIQLITPESVALPLWKQYTMLAMKMNQTLEMLRGLNAKGVPSNVPLGPVQNEPTPISAPIKAEPASLFLSPDQPASQVSLSKLVRDGAAEIRNGICHSALIEYIKRVDPKREIKSQSLSALISQISQKEGWIQVGDNTPGVQIVYNLP